MPTVSIITTVYNREHYLMKAIASFLAQSYADAELLIWDDGSTDQSVAIAQHYAKQDPRIRVVAAEHLGRGEALRQAIAATDSPYLGLLDSDDALAFSALDETVPLLESHPLVGMVYTNYYEMDSLGKVKGVGHRCQMPYSKDRLLVDFMTFHFRLLRRSLYDLVGGVDPWFTYAQDYDLCLKLSEVTQIYHLAKPLYYYRWHQKSVSCEQQLEQIKFSQQAVMNALNRRGLHHEIELEVRLSPQFVLKRKPTHKPGS